MLELCLFLLVLNFDAFLTGLAFGLVGIHITFAASVLIAGCSGLFFGGGMIFGGILLAILPYEAFHDLSLLFLFLLALFLIAKYCGKESRGRFSGLWRNPEKQDSNADEVISAGEGVALGVAIAMDALVGGLAFGLIGENVPFWSALTALMCYILLVGANALGKFLQKNLRQRRHS
jgi:putative Mn2+ efflux pump MntP